MEESVQAPAPPQKPKMSKEERSKRMQEAATRRWAKAKREKAKAAKAKAVAKATRGPKKAPSPREFSTALKTAEKRLAKAIQERAEAASKYAVLNAEIPSLQRLILALKNPLGAMPEYGVPVAPTIEQIVGGERIAYANPPRRSDIPAMPVPQQLHPANTAQQSRAGGGAVAVELNEGVEEEDEDKFLNESPMTGGQWR